MSALPRRREVDGDVIRMSLLHWRMTAPALVPLRAIQGIQIKGIARTRPRFRAPRGRR